MPNPPTNLSLRGFARLIGVDEAAVRRGVRLGRLAESVVYVKGRPKIGNIALARAEWVANADPGRRLAAGQPVDLEPLAAPAEPLATAWNRYVDAIRTYEARVEAVYVAALEAAGLDPETIPPWPKGFEAWARLAEAELEAIRRLEALGAALEAAGVLTFAPPNGPSRGRPPFEHP